MKYLLALIFFFLTLPVWGGVVMEFDKAMLNTNNMSAAEFMAYYNNLIIHDELDGRSYQKLMKLAQERNLYIPPLGKKQKIVLNPKKYNDQMFWFFGFKKPNSDKERYKILTSEEFKVSVRDFKKMFYGDKIWKETNQKVVDFWLEVGINILEVLQKKREYLAKRESERPLAGHKVYEVRDIKNLRISTNALIYRDIPKLKPMSPLWMRLFLLAEDIDDLNKEIHTLTDKTRLTVLGNKFRDKMSQFNKYALEMRMRDEVLQHIQIALSSQRNKIRFSEDIKPLQLKVREAYRKRIKRKEEGLPTRDTVSMQTQRAGEELLILKEKIKKREEIVIDSIKKAKENLTKIRKDNAMLGNDILRGIYSHEAYQDIMDIYKENRKGIPEDLLKELDDIIPIIRKLSALVADDKDVSYILSVLEKQIRGVSDPDLKGRLFYLMPYINSLRNRKEKGDFIELCKAFVRISKGMNVGAGFQIETRPLTRKERMEWLKRHEI